MSRSSGAILEPRGEPGLAPNFPKANYTASIGGPPLGTPPAADATEFFSYRRLRGYGKGK
jgi:hypothetical protein